MPPTSNAAAARVLLRILTEAEQARDGADQLEEGEERKAS
jgi:hypothetical protein